jgi:hypothetical protein
VPRCFVEAGIRLVPCCTDEGGAGKTLCEVKGKGKKRLRSEGHAKRPEDLAQLSQKHDSVIAAVKETKQKKSKRDTALAKPKKPDNDGSGTAERKKRTNKTVEKPALSEDRGKKGGKERPALSEDGGTKGGKEGRLRKVSAAHESPHQTIKLATSPGLDASSTQAGAIGDSRESLSYVQPDCQTTPTIRGLKIVDDITEHSIKQTVFVGNVPQGTQPKDLKQHFKRWVLILRRHDPCC